LPFCGAVPLPTSRDLLNAS